MPKYLDDLTAALASHTPRGKIDRNSIERVPLRVVFRTKGDQGTLNVSPDRTVDVEGLMMFSHAEPKFLDGRQTHPPVKAEVVFVVNLPPEFVRGNKLPSGAAADPKAGTFSTEPHPGISQEFTHELTPAGLVPKPPAATMAVPVVAPPGVTVHADKAPEAPAVPVRLEGYASWRQTNDDRQTPDTPNPFNGTYPTQGDKRAGAKEKSTAANGGSPDA